SGAWPSVISVTISRLSTYSVSGCSPAMGVGSTSPRSFSASTSNVSGREAWVSLGFILAADIRHLDLAQRDRVQGPDLGVAVGAPRPDRADFPLDVVIGRARAQQR